MEAFKTTKFGESYCSKSCKEKKQEERKIKLGSPYLKKRFIILTRDNFTCQYCGRSVKEGVILEIDHIDPKSNGGENKTDNLITSCKDCNIGKRDILLEAHNKKKFIQKTRRLQK